MTQFKLLVLSYFLPFSKLFVWHLHIQRHILRKLVVMGTLIVCTIAYLVLQTIQ